MKKVFSNTPPQSFIIDEDVLSACSIEEVDATWRVLQELKIDRPPYSHFDILIPGKIIFRLFKDERFQEIFNETAGIHQDILLGDRLFTIRYDNGGFDLGAQKQ